MKFSINAPSKKKKPTPVKAIFDDEEDDEKEETSTVNEKLLAERIRDKSKGKIQQRLQEALEEDPSVFDYDSVLPQLNNDRKRIAESKAKNKQTKSKYIEVLMEKAEQRKFEYERVRETQILKQIEEEKAIYGEKPQYTTSAYKEHLKERKKWEEEQEKKANEVEDVTTKKDMTSFYNSNFLSNVIGDRLSDDNPLVVSQKEKEMKEDEEKTKLESKLISKEDTKVDKGSKTTKTMEGDDEEEVIPQVPKKPVLTREQKIEAARERYFARHGMKMDER